MDSVNTCIGSIDVATGIAEIIFQVDSKGNGNPHSQFKKLRLIYYTLSKTIL
jgi:hypothetical protein